MSPSLGLLSKDSDWTLISELESLYVRARTFKRQYYGQWRRNYLLLNAKMWSENRPSWMPSPVDSEIYPIISSYIAWMMDQQVSFSVSPAANPHTPFASYMNKLAVDLETVLESNWELNDYRSPIQLALWDATQCGSGILKAVWDTGSDGGLGNALIKRIDPWNFYPDPNATSMDDANFFIEVKRLSFDELQRHYPLAYDNIMYNVRVLEDGASGPGDDPRPFIYDNSRRPMTNLGALPGGSGQYGLPGQSRMHATNVPGINVYECWIRENNIETDLTPDTDPLSDLSNNSPLISDRWRVVVHAAGVVLMDELAIDLWEYSRHPYARYVFDDIGEFWGISLISHLSNPQIAVNRLLSSLQHNAEITGNPVYLEPSNSGISRQAIINRPGERLQYNSGAGSGQNQPHWMEPPSMPAYLMDMVKFWIERMQNISGMAPLAGSKDGGPGARASERTVTSVQESSFVRIRNSLRNLETTLRSIGNMLSQLIIENYTIPRTMAIVGPDGIKSALSLSAKHFYSPYRNQDGQRFAPLRYSLIVTAGANNPTSRQARIAEADTLFALGAIDQQAVLEAHGYPNWQPIIQRITQQQQQLALLGQLGQAQHPGARQRARRKE